MKKPKRKKMTMEERKALAKERYEFASDMYAPWTWCVRAWIRGFLGVNRK
jgi:hypothetical protein